MTKIVVDANLLCLIVAGQFAPLAIGRHKRLKAFSYSDYEKVMEITAYFSAAVTCPNVLTETSNLLAGTNANERAILLNGLSTMLNGMEERHTPSLLACKSPLYPILGLTDAVLLTLDLTNAVLFTIDLDLVLAAQAVKKRVINYNWVRDQDLTGEILGLSI